MLIYIFGDGGQASWAVDIARVNGDTTIIVDKAEEAECLKREDFKNYHVAIGDNFTRQKVAEKISYARPAADFTSLIHPRSIISKEAKIGGGCLVLANAVIGPYAVVGRGVSIWTGAILEHHSFAHDFVSLAPGAVTGGSVILNDRAFLGLNVCVKHQTEVGVDAIIGAGATVVKNVPDRTISYGNPSKVTSRRNTSDPYLR